MHITFRYSEEYYKNLIEKHVILIFGNSGVVLEAIDIVACHR